MAGKHQSSISEKLPKAYRGLSSTRHERQLAMLKKGTTKRAPFRMDFVIENPEMVGKAKGKVLMRFRLVPDPRIWQPTKKDGKEGYINKSDNTFVPMSVLAKMTRQLPGVPITYYPPPGFTGINEYIRKSRGRLGKDGSKKEK